MSSQTIALLTILGASFFWSTAGVITKILLRIFDPFPLAFLRFFLASLVVIPFFLKQKSIPFKSLVREVIPISLLSTGNIIFFYLGIALTTVNASSIIYTMTPLFVALFSKILLKEQLTRKKIVGLTLGLVGVLLIILLPVIEKSTVDLGNTKGNILILIATACWSLYTIGSRYLTIQKQYSPISVSAVSMYVSAILFALLLFLVPHKNFIVPLYEPSTFFLVLFLAIGVTVATYLLYQWAIKHSSATTASLTNYLQPVFSIGLAIIFLGEKITLGFIVGGALVFLGVFLATGSQVLHQINKFVKK